MSLSDEQQKFLYDVTLLVQYAIRLGFKTTPGEMLRTEDQQRIYFASGRSKTMNSMHLKGLAVDLNFIMKGQYINGLDGPKAVEILKPIGMFWESLSPKNRAGMNFDRDFRRKDPWIDAGHFERFV